LGSGARRPMAASIARSRPSLPSGWGASGSSFRRRRRCARPLRPGGPRKVDRPGMVRFGSGRYAVAQELVGSVVEVRAEEGEVVVSQHGRELIRHGLVARGEVALGPYADRMRRPARGVRPRTAAEVAFLGLGAAAEAFL